jgi:hypothetical protein
MEKLALKSSLELECCRRIGVGDDLFLWNVAFIYYCCAGWGYTGVFAKVHTMYQIYLNSPLLLLLSFILPSWFLEQFQQVSFLHLLTYVYIIWTTSPCPQAEPVLLSCSPILYKKKHKNMVFLLVWDKDSYTEICYVVSMHMCITNQISLSLPDLFVIP